MKYEQLAKDILSLVGGPENVVEVRHCATRLRLKLNDALIAKDDEIKKLKEVMNVVKAGGQYQIIIGQTVPDLYSAIMQMWNYKGSQKNDENKLATKESLGNRFFQVIQGIFPPFIFIMAAAGITNGIRSVLVFTGVLNQGEALERILYVVGTGAMQGLPVLLGYTVMKTFKGTPLLGAVLGLILIHPQTTAFANAQWTNIPGEGWTRTGRDYLFGFIPVIMPRGGYVQTVLPIIGAGIFAAKLENFLKKKIPVAIKAFFVPLLTMIVTITVTFIIIGPIATYITLGIAGTISWIFGLGGRVGGTLAGIFVGGFWQVLVISGVHLSIPPIANINLFETGRDQLMPLWQTSAFAQLGAVIAVIIKTKSAQMRERAIPTAVSGLFGVSEPIIYGVNLPLKRPFIFACISAAIAGGIVGFLGTYRYRPGGWGFLIFPSYFPGEDQLGYTVNSFRSLINMLIATVIALGLGFLITFFLGFTDLPEDDLEKSI